MESPQECGGPKRDIRVMGTVSVAHLAQLIPRSLVRSPIQFRP